MNIGVEAKRALVHDFKNQLKPGRDKNKNRVFAGIVKAVHEANPQVVGHYNNLKTLKPNEKPWQKYWLQLPPKVQDGVNNLWKQVASAKELLKG